MAAPGRRPLSLALAYGLAAVPLARGQYYKLEDVPIPDAFSLDAQYLFHVYNEQDSPVKGDQKPTIEFRQLMVKKSGEEAPTQPYKSVEVSLIPYDNFWSLVQPQGFCTTVDDVKEHRAEECCRLKLTKPRGKEIWQVGARVEIAPFEAASRTVSFPIASSGKYLLTFTNCGSFSKGVLTGAVVVRHAHGYLPAPEYFTMKLYGFLAFVYAGLAAAWFFAAFLKAPPTGLFYIQKGISIVVVFGLLETLVSYVQYQDWNSTGLRRDVLFVTSLMFYTLKYVMAWRLVLMAALGAGIVSVDLNAKNTALFFVVSTIFLAQACTWKLIMSYRHSHALDTTFLLLITGPGVLIYMGMFSWSFFGLSTSLANVLERKQEELATIFTQVQLVLGAGAIMAGFVMFLQVLDIAQGGALLSWEYQWLSIDGAPHFAFALTLIGMMKVWWPSPDGWKFGYMLQVDSDEAEADNELGKNNKVRAEAIGCAEPADAPDEE